MYRILTLVSIFIICLGLQSCTTNADLEKRIAGLENKIKKYEEIIIFNKESLPYISLKDTCAGREMTISPSTISIKNQKSGNLYIMNILDTTTNSVFGPSILAYNKDSILIYSLGADSKNEGELILAGYSSGTIMSFRDNAPTLNMFKNNKILLRGRCPQLCLRICSGIRRFPHYLACQVAFLCKI